MIRRQCVLFTTSLLLCAGSAVAVIKVDTTVRRLYEWSRQVAVGEVSRVDAAKGIVDVAVSETAKGPAAREIRVQLGEAAGLAREMKVGQPAVLFVGKAAGAALHVADTWLKAEEAGPAAWNVTGRFDVLRTFPGRTRALVQVVRELKQGQYSLTDKVMHHTWYQKRKVANLGLKAAFASAADVDGDRKSDLLVVTPDGGVHLLLAAGEGYKDATAAWGLAPASAGKAAFCDVNGDGKPDLLLNTLWLHNGSRFEEARAAVDLAGKGDVLALSLADLNADGKPDAAVLLRSGELLVSENPGSTDRGWAARPAKALWKGGEAPLAAHFGDWGDDGKLRVMAIRESGITRYALDGGEPPADFLRLTGETVLYRDKPRYFPMTDYTGSAAMDRNGGDGRPDLFIATKSGVPRDMELINRGFGTYFTNTEAGFGYHPTGRGRATPLAPVAMTAADVYGDGSQEMLLITEKGDLYQFDSPPYPFPK